MRAFEMRSVRQLLMASVAALFPATGTAHAAGVDYICGHYSFHTAGAN
jgi:hypothetical protein